MTNRYCPKCASEVEDTGGYCLLGHRLGLSAPSASLRELRAEVDRAFEDARVSVTSAVGPASHPVAATSTAPPPPPPRPPRAQTQTSAEPEPRPAQPSVWHGLSSERTPGHDPIVAFAPAPRMDWGPERKTLLRRLRARPERRDPAFQS